MSKELVISASPHETRVAIVEDGQLCEIYIEREKEFALVGSLYKGRVTRVLPGMQSAFVDIGLDSDAFLYVSDFLENLEDYDHVAAPPVKAAALTPAPPPNGETLAPAEAGPSASVTDAPEESVETPPSLPEQIPASLSVPAEASPAASGGAKSTAPPQPHERRPNRGQGGPGDRGRRGRRWGRRGPGDRHGRDLPSSKYASPGTPADSRTHESQPYEPPPANYQPVILPGESLAKYKDRVPPGTGGPGETAAPAATADAETHGSTGSGNAGRVGSLPSSLYAPAEKAGQSSYRDAAEFVPEPESQAQTHSSGEEFTYAQPFPTDPAAVSETPAGATPRDAHLTAEPEPVAEIGSPLSDDEMSTLAQQLVEVKHEEAQAGAKKEQIEAAEAAVVPFVEEAELEELEDAFHNVQGEEAGTEVEMLTDQLEDEAEASASEPSEHGEHLEEHAAAGAPHPSESQPSNARVSQPPRARFQRPMRRGGRHRRRGGPSHEQRSHAPQRTQQRRPQLISEVLKAGQEIIVQIAKEPLGKKGARITSHVALPGRFLVYMPTVDHIGVSHRIGSAEDRARLRHVVTEAKGTFPGGFIVRTAAASASDDEIRADAEFLGRTWDTIRAGAEQRHAPALLHRDLNLVERILRDYLSDDYAAIWIDNEEEYGKVLEFVGRFQPRLINRVKLYTKESPIFEEFGIQQELDKALRPKVWLKSGGYIVINHTEALVAIDVNTGKFVGRGSTRLEDTIVRTNLEAVNEIVRQIRLRDLGGIIVVDFIDMEERRNREKVLSALEHALNQDRAPSKALAFNEFGLVCITRKRTKQALERVLCQPCPYCTGSGMVKSVPTICYEIQAEARKMAAELDTRSVTLRVNPEIAKALKTRESLLVDELEQTTRKSVIIQSDPTLHWEQYDIY